MTTIIEFGTLFGFVIACVAIVIVPGPTVTVIIANSLRNGAYAGLLNVAGTQMGLAMMLLIVAFGLEVITTSLAWLFDWLRIIGAIYLVWLGVKLLRSDGSIDATKGSKKGGSFIWQGCLVIWSNPKALLFYGSFIPQFVDPGANAFAQTVFLGLVFMAVATILDSAYAFLAGSAGSVLTKGNVRATELAGGSLLVGGGVWLGFSRW